MGTLRVATSAIACSTAASSAPPEAIAVQADAPRFDGCQWCIQAGWSTRYMPGPLTIDGQLFVHV
ncbi:hypothetical protein PF008_g23132 [Phytophthora fragariae]|uniref:Uncharacterized protein n=1 Tax=Phytophthora fragariae TaxID=53985 RepID=A0A6G0QSQ2_9STRA|nr:hypothetical protein PF008_g23132 [Phytophthora fragariae]